MIRRHHKGWLARLVAFRRLICGEAELAVGGHHRNRQIEQERQMRAALVSRRLGAKPKPHTHHPLWKEQTHA
ncbi:MAG: hypothetical protein ACXW3D_01195 [Caulobacteraceae bacterium]